MFRKLFMLVLSCLILQACETEKPVTKAPPLPVVKSPAPKPVFRVGALLPLSGPHKGMGQQLLNAMEMALFEHPSSDFCLIVEDSGEGAEEAFKRLKAQKVSLVLGPLLAAEVRSLRSEGIPLLTFSNDGSLKNPSTYVLGFSLQGQLDFLRKQLPKEGILDASMIIPSGDFGFIVSSLASQYNFDKRGGSVVILPQEGLVTSPEVKTIALMGVQKGGWKVIPAKDRFASFSVLYEQKFSIPCPRIASLGYEAMALATYASQRGMSALFDPEGFESINGHFYMRPDGTLERVYRLEK